MPGTRRAPGVSADLARSPTVWHTYQVAWRATPSREGRCRPPRRGDEPPTRRGGSVAKCRAPVPPGQPIRRRQRETACRRAAEQGRHARPRGSGVTTEPAPRQMYGERETGTSDGGTEDPHPLEVV